MSTFLDNQDGTLTITGWVDLGDGTGFYPGEYDFGNGEDGATVTLTVTRGTTGSPVITVGPAHRPGLTVTRTLPALTVTIGSR